MIARIYRPKRARVNALETAGAAFMVDRHRTIVIFRNRVCFARLNTLWSFAVQASREMQRALSVADREPRKRSGILTHRGVNVIRGAVPQRAR